MITQRSSSATQTTRASSNPHCSLSTPSAGCEQRLRVDRPAVDAVRGARDGEVRDPASGPRRGRAGRSCRRPRAAAGLKTALTGYGQSSAVRIGLAGWRWKSSRGRHAARRRSRVPRRAGRPAARPRRAAARRGGTRASTRRLRCRSSSRRRARRCSRRSRSRTAVGARRLRPRNQSNARCARSAVLGIAGDGERGELGLDERGGVERLLVAAAREPARRDAGRGGRSAAACPRRARTRRRASGATRGPSRSGPRGRARRRRRSARAAVARCRSVSSSSNQRQSVVGVRARRPPASCSTHALEQLRRAGLEPVGVEAREAERGVGGGAQRRPRRRACRRA